MLSRRIAASVDAFLPMYFHRLWIRSEQRHSLYVGLWSTWELGDDDMAAKIVSAAGGGTVSPDVAAALMGLLKDKAIINEKGELMRRLEELEERIKNGSGTPKAD